MDRLNRIVSGDKTQWITLWRYHDGEFAVTVIGALALAVVLLGIAAIAVMFADAIEARRKVPSPERNNPADFGRADK